MVSVAARPGGCTMRNDPPAEGSSGGVLKFTTIAWPSVTTTPSQSSPVLRICEASQVESARTCAVCARMGGVRSAPSSVMSAVLTSSVSPPNSWTRAAIRYR